MTSRERLRKTLQRQEPDRVPIDFGQDFHNGINEVVYQKLLGYLEIDVPDSIPVYDLMQRLAVVDERVLERFHVDTRYIMANPNEHFSLKLEEDGSFEDEWGVYRKRCGYYCDTVRSPLVRKSPWTRLHVSLFRTLPSHPGSEDLREKARQLYETTNYALMAGQAASLYYFSAELRGFEDFMADLADNPALVDAAAGPGPRVDDGVYLPLPGRNRRLSSRAGGWAMTGECRPVPS